MLLLISLSFALKPSNDSCEALCIRDGFQGGKKYKKGCVCLEVKDDFNSFVKGLVRVGVVDRRFPIKIEFNGEDVEPGQ